MNPEHQEQPNKHRDGRRCRKCQLLSSTRRVPQTSPPWVAAPFSQSVPGVRALLRFITSFAQFIPGLVRFVTSWKSFRLRRRPSYDRRETKLRKTLHSMHQTSKRTRGALQHAISTSEHFSAAPPHRRPNDDAQARLGALGAIISLGLPSGSFEGPSESKASGRRGSSASKMQ